MILSIILIVAVIVLVFLILLIFGRVKVEVDGHYIGSDMDLKIKVKLWGIRLYAVQVPEVEVSTSPFRLFFKKKQKTPVGEQAQEKDVNEEDIDRITGVFGQIKNALQGSKLLEHHILRMIKIRQLHWQTTIGLGEADATAIVVGLFWGLKANILGILQHLLSDLGRPAINVLPNYQSAHFETHFKCMITFRLGQAITAAFRIAKQWKGRRNTSCQNIQYKG